MKLVDAYLEFFLAHHYRPATIRSYRERIGSFIRWCGRMPLPMHTKKRPALRTLQDGMGSG
jgi:hypothetical protein